jgi:nitrogen regulatory protein P-II 2
VVAVIAQRYSYSPQSWGFLPLIALQGGLVKLIIAIIQPSRLESVKEALSEVEVFRLTVLDVQGFGRQRGHAETYRGHEIAVNLLRKVQLQIAVNDDFVLPMDECVRIRTGERGGEAI